MNTIGQHDWCPECSGPSVVVDDSIESTLTSGGEDYYRVITLDCGHDLQTPTTRQPDLPYAGTSGWAGTDTSKERAVTADTSGKTSKRQSEVLAAVESMGTEGVTVAELRECNGYHHGSASNVLSVLHKVGKLERLVEKRNKCHVYVHPSFVDGRDTQPHGRTGTVTLTQEEYDRLIGRY